MRRTAILMLVLSLFLGVLAVYLARDWVEEQVASANKVESKQVNLTTVVIAKRPLRFGDELNASAMAEVEWPANSVPPESFKKIGEIVGAGERRVVLKRIELNEPILKSKVSGFGGRATLSTIIDQKFRAVTIRVNDVNGVAGFVLPGDRVDVLLTRSLEGSKEQITDVLMQNMKVLGIDQDAAEEREKPKVARAVTLEVTTEQSQKLTLAQRVGQLSLALRGATNNDPVAHRRIREKDLVDDRLIEDRKVSADKAEKPSVKPVKKVVRVRPRNTRSSVRVYRALEPKTVEVPSEAAPKRTPSPVTVPTKRSPAGQNSAGDSPGKNADRAREEGPTSAGPTRLTPKPRVDETPSTVPVPERPIVPKTRDSMVELRLPRSLVVRR